MRTETTFRAELELLHALAAPARDLADTKHKLQALLAEVAASHGPHEAAVTLVDLPASHDLGPADRASLPACAAYHADQGRLLGHVLFVVDPARQSRALADHLAAGDLHTHVLAVHLGEDLTFDLWQGPRRLRTFAGPGGALQLLSRFLLGPRPAIQRPQQLAAALARRARQLQRVAARQLAAEEQTGAGELLALRAAFTASLAHLDAPAFADAFAQTLAYGLLSARWLSHAAPERFTREQVPRLLPTTTPFLAALFNRLVGARLGADIDWIVADILALLGDTPVREVFAAQDGEPIQDPAIHFYEHFLDEYDPRLRRQRGVYYTPDAVVSYIVNTAHSTLQERFGLRLGLADTTTWAEFSRTRGIPIPPDLRPGDPFVQILDPATGTGTFLLRVIEVIHATMMQEYADRGHDPARSRELWRAYVHEHLLPRVHGLELMLAPFMVCHLRLGLALERTGFVFGRGEAGDDERLRVYFADTLQSADTGPGDPALAAEAASAAWTRQHAPISVIVGNPPYERESADTQDRTRPAVRALLADYLDPTRDAGGGGHLKNLYNLYVYFWRWATWRVFDRRGAPGIVSFITASSYLRGPGFAGMREQLRRVADDFHVLDLEGDQKGARKTENVFEILIGVAVGTAIRTGLPASDTPANTWYARIPGSAADKLAACNAYHSLRAVAWAPAATAWSAEMVAGGLARTGYDTWPKLGDLFPWQHSGVQYKRRWPIAETRELLDARWSALLAAPDRAVAFRETAAWTIARAAPGPLFPGAEATPALAALPPSAPAPRVLRYGFRSFDRQHAFADERLGDRLRPPLWRALGEQQIYLACLLTKVLGHGPAATASAHVPDLDYFCNRGGKDIIPLWRDPEATRPNVTAGLVAALARAHGRAPNPEDIFAYAYAVLANPGYVRRFAEPLQLPGPRLPLTRDPALFERGAALGRTLLRWHTYGERLRDPDDGFALTGAAAVLAEIPDTPAGYPERHHYDPSRQVLHVGAGQIGPVSPGVYGFAVSGLQIVKSWLDYRMKKGAGKRSSPLDELRPGRWTAALTRELLELCWALEWTLAQYPTLDAWLDEVLASPLLAATELPLPGAAEREPQYCSSK